MYPESASVATTLMALELLASVLLGLGVLGVAWHITGIVLADRGDGRRWASFETARRQTLRQANRVYLWFEPLVDELAEYYATRRPMLRQRIERGLLALPEQPPWTPAEWLAVQRLTASGGMIGLGLGLGWLCHSCLGMPALGILGAALVWFITSRRPLLELEEKANRVRSQIRGQLPFAMDLMQLMLKAGSSFTEALQTLVRQNCGAALAGHLEIVLREIERGITRSEALRRLQLRLNMEEINELVLALRQGDELGTPLTQILESQALQIRNRQVQAIEKAAEQSKVKFAGPNTVVMVASIIAMLAPWLLKVLYEATPLFH